MRALEFVNFALALGAFFLAVRVVARRRALPAGLGRSWPFLTVSTLLLALIMGLQLVDSSWLSDESVLLDLLQFALVSVLLFGFFFLYVYEHRAMADAQCLADRERDRSRRFEAIVKLGNELRATQDLQSVLDAVGAAVDGTLSFRENAIYLHDEETDTFVARVVLGGDAVRDEAISNTAIPRPVVEGLLREQFRIGNCYFVDHGKYTWSDEEAKYFPPSSFEYLGPGHFHPDDGLFVPLYDHEGRMIALFDVYNPEDGQLPSSATLQMLEIFANVAATAIENARYQETLRQQAVTDGLTGLYNHRHFQEMLATEVDRARRYGLSFTLLMMDLDFFKQVNDRFGHPRGDEALEEVAAVLRSLARSSDFVARYGGEEFVMILPETTARQAQVVAERIREKVREIVLPVHDPPRVSISIGVADYPTCGRTRESLISAADAALLFAKRQGRDQVVHFSGITTDSLDRGLLEGLAYRLEQADIETLEALAHAIDSRDPFAKRHSAAVAHVLDEVLKDMPFNETEANGVRMAARVYDIGKIGIPAEVLGRIGELDADDRAVIEKHPEVGKRLVESAMKLVTFIPVVLHHHERWDGTGYPAGLKGEEIPLAARLIAVCDSYQAMISERPYRAAMTKKEAIAELRNKAGTQFDPRLVDLFVASLERRAAGVKPKPPGEAGEQGGDGAPVRDEPRSREVEDSATATG